MRSMSRGAIHGERVSQRISAEGSRPPRSFPGGVVLLLVQEMLPLREAIERGRACATPKAGLGIQGLSQALPPDAEPVS